MAQRGFDPFVDTPEDTPSLEHPFMDFVASESHVSAGDRAWERWVNRAERELGHSLDGNQERDGYSVDYAYDAWKDGVSVDDYVAEVVDAKAHIAGANQAVG